MILLKVLRRQSRWKVGQDQLSHNSADVHTQKALVPLPALTLDTAGGHVHAHHERQRTSTGSSDNVVTCAQNRQGVQGTHLKRRGGAV